ncbi:hypothetical protein [Jeotgalibacillus proteolyticus]|uniref:Intracellular proteinase inhibitor BsuPI domain-containing protein n=1 Tax=Jeotgalibacillus proteolyticus TaxID=2082395 RepID=A0A2S5GCG3_9BACL|nr:hypothetical protein [Jeotgalibacillus proteolyticus]PPA70605.1 hypothetical protein C4B60_07330 [Jeotgalibacillus proteolyticus]
MRKSSWAGLAVFALGIGFFAFVYFWDDGSHSGERKLYDYNINGLELNVVTNGTEFKEGEDIIVEVTLTNELGAPVTYDMQCGEPLQIEIEAAELNNTLVNTNGEPGCDGPDESEKGRMISNEQLSKSVQFPLEIPVNDEETVLAPEGQYSIKISFYPTAQQAFITDIPISINQQNQQLTDPAEAKQEALLTNEAQSWFSLYGDTEKYIVSEELPYLEDNHWVLTWKAKSTDTEDTLEDQKLVLQQPAFTN